MAREDGRAGRWRRILLALALGVVACAAGLVGMARAQVFYEREQVEAAKKMMAEGTSPEALAGQKTSRNDGWLRKMQVQFPEADLNGDGILTEAEGTIWHQQQVHAFPPQGHELDNLPEGVSHWTVMVPMRDGVKLATEVYLPAGGGPWPAIITRTNRGRMDSALDYGDALLESGDYAFVGQDPYPADAGGGRGRGGARRNSITDGYDTVEWVAAQPWCDGNVAMFGYSEAGMTSKSALLANPPHLKVQVTSITGISRNPWQDGGVRSAGRGGRFGGRGGGAPRAAWTPPAPMTEPYKSPYEGVAEGISIPTNEMDGWFDMFTQPAIDEFVYMQHTGKAIFVMGSGGHGPVSTESRKPPDYSDCDIFWSKLPKWRWLTGEVDPAASQTTMYYFLMGDAVNPDAPGNVWKVTHHWPVPSTPTAFYLTGQSGLRTSPPADDGALTYAYDPHDPCPSIGGTGTGMMDQRPLEGRKDILRFETEPLSAPVEMTGAPSVDLYVSSDRPDTIFTATLIDVYPDGWESILRDGAVMARFHEGFDNPQPLEPGKVYRLTIHMIPTAFVFDRGHKIRVNVTSSGTPRFEVHPNTWDAIESMDQAVVAHNTVHASARYASKLTLPVVAPDAVPDYKPGD